MMARKMFSILILILALNCHGQQKQVHCDTIFYNDTIQKEIHIQTETFPEFPGGEKALITYIKQYIKYPVNAIKDSIEGSVSIRFSIDENGFTGNISFLKSIYLEIDTVCVNMIKNMPQWKPGSQLTNSKKGWYWRPLKSWYSINLNFTVTNNNKLTGIIITP
jgi:hypothetical protein